MKIQLIFLNFIMLILSVFFVNAQDIPIEYLNMELQPNQKEYTKTILNNEIKDINVEHITVTGDITKKANNIDGFSSIYLFIKGNGIATSNSKNYDIVPETILLPNAVKDISFKAIKNDTLHYIKISSPLTKQDIIDLEELPKENTQNIYLAKFIDCKAYTEAIKSPKTTSRTILTNKYIPRKAMGTVETIGPDKVEAHEHPMLEQLFLGLSGNQTIVYADDAKINFPEYSILHIPLGSSHSVEVKEGSKMYYVWMDFFLDKKGEEWLKTHKSSDKK